MRKKLGLFWFAAALLGAALIFGGCPTEADTETKYVSGEMIYLDVLVANVNDLKTELGREGALAIGFTGSSTNGQLAENLTILEGKLVYILNGSTLATNGKALTVEGIVYVGIGGKLDVSTGNVIVKEGGSVSVLPVKSVAAITTGVLPGTLKVATVDDVNDGASPTPKTVLGSDKVWIGGALEFTVLDSATAVTDAFGYVRDKGTVVGVGSALTPSAIAAITAPSGDKKLVMTTSVADPGTAPLTIPAWLKLTTSGTLNAITGLTVNGSLAASTATLEAVTTLTVNGTLNAPAATFAALTTVTGTGSIVAGVVPSANAVILIGSTISDIALKTATLAADVTVSGNLTFLEALSLSKAITIGTTGTVTLAKTKAITLADADEAKITGGTAYEFTPASATNGTLTAGVADVTFSAAAISSVGDTSTLSAATLAFGVADSTLTIKDATSVRGVVLDVAAKGKIVVTASKVLTLALGGDSDGILSGGIFTLAVASDASTLVKANAATVKTSDTSIATAVKVGLAKLEAADASGISANGNLGTGGASTAPASGTITGDTGGTTIDTADTFAVSGAAITVTHS